MAYNIFCGNKTIEETIAKALGYESDQKHSWFTEDIYFETFFYLSKRFGSPKILDEYKDAGTWDFKVKQYTIRISLNTSWVTFIVFGDYKFFGVRNNPYWIKREREIRKKKHLLLLNLENTDKRSDYENETIRKLLDEFLIEKGLDDSISNEEFNKKFGTEFWFNRIQSFNNSILNIDFKEYEKYGDYSNSGTRHAKRTLIQFIHNMLTPIWVRDCAFNIKGKMSDSYACEMEKYSDNIKIKLEQ